MIQGLRLFEQFQGRYANKTEVSYNLNNGRRIIGPLRSMQKFLVILLTDIGSDPIRPWFGTNINKLTQTNIVNKTETELFIRNECTSAIEQFFTLQQKESTQNDQTGYDVIQSIEIISVNINTNNQVSITLKFTPLRYEAITFAVDL